MYNFPPLASFIFEKEREKLGVGFFLKKNDNNNMIFQLPILFFSYDTIHILHMQAYLSIYISLFYAK